MVGHNNLIYFIIQGEAKVFRKHMNQDIFLCFLNRLSFIGTELLFCKHKHYEYLIKSSNDMILVVAKADTFPNKVPKHFYANIHQIYLAKKQQRLKQFNDYIDKVNSIKIKRVSKTDLTSID